MNRPADSLEALAAEMMVYAEKYDEDVARDWSKRLAALTPQPPASGVPFDVVREVVRARTKLGFASPEGQEEQAARAVELIRELCEEVLAHNYAAPTPAAVPDAVRGLDEFPSLPSAAEWLDGTRGLASHEWMAGWDAARNRLQTMRMTEAALSAAPEQTSKIPTGVYYSPFAANFYSADTKRGMGGAFFQAWFARRAEFPLTRAAAMAQQDGQP